MAVDTDYSFIGNGEAMIAECDEITGDPLDFDFMGNVSAMSIGFQKNRVERRNYRRKGNPIDKASNITTDANISITAMDLDTRVMQRYFGGSEFTIAAGSVTGEALALNLTDAKWGDPVTEDALVSLANTNIDLDATIELRYGTSGSVTNVVPAANYTVSRHGDVQIAQAYLSTLTVANATHWEIDYTHKGIAQGSGFAAGNRSSGCTKRYWLKVSGNNLSECGSGEYQTVDIYKVVLTPEGDMSLISEEYTELNFTGLVLLDSTRPNSPEWEEYFRVRRFGE
jgi:hypothetical protein